MKNVTKYFFTPDGLKKFTPPNLTFIKNLTPYKYP
jgi:hypothetical protein